MIGVPSVLPVCCFALVRLVLVARVSLLLVALLLAPLPPVPLPAPVSSSSAFDVLTACFIVQVSVAAVAGCEGRGRRHGNEGRGQRQQRQGGERCPSSETRAR